VGRAKFGKRDGRVMDLLGLIRGMLCICDVWHSTYKALIEEIMGPKKTVPANVPVGPLDSAMAQPPRHRLPSGTC
jgi:hypothetical protein